MLAGNLDRARERFPRGLASFCAPCRRSAARTEGHWGAEGVTKRVDDVRALCRLCAVCGRDTIMSWLTRGKAKHSRTLTFPPTTLDPPTDTKTRRATPVLPEKPC